MASAHGQAGALEAIGDRWAVLLLRDLSLGLSRYDDLQASTGMPTTTLSTRLKHLETTGLIERTPYQDNPPRFEYRLTDKGRDLWKVTTALREWGDRWNANGLGASTIEMVDGRSGRPVVLALVDVLRCDELWSDVLAPVPVDTATGVARVAAAGGLS